MIEPITENRTENRTHLFVAATVSWPNGTMPARLRNVSPGGALLEMEAGPSINDRVKIRRGELSATGSVVWRMGKRLGVRFDRPIVAANWLPATPKRQQEVDATVQAAKDASPQVRQLSAVPLRASDLASEELAGVADMLDALADSFSEDPDIVARYSDKLQVLDIASQSLRKISA